MHNKEVVIIGGGSGISTRLIQEYSKRYAVIVFSRKKRLIESPNITNITVADYDPKFIVRKVKELSNTKHLIILIMNGVSDEAPFFKLADDEIDRVFEINVKIPLKLTKSFINEFLQSELSFVYFSSTRAEMGDLGITLYAASKAGLTAASKNLAQEYGKFKKYFYVISLGVFEAGLIDKLSEQKIKDITRNSAVRGTVPFEDLFRTIELTFLNRSASGSVLYCDNGYRQC